MKTIKCISCREEYDRPDHQPASTFRCPNCCCAWCGKEAEDDYVTVCGDEVCEACADKYEEECGPSDRRAQAHEDALLRADYERDRAMDEALELKR